MESSAAGWKLDAIYWQAIFKGFNDLDLLLGGGLYGTICAFIHCEWRYSSVAISGATEVIKSCQSMFPRSNRKNLSGAVDQSPSAPSVGSFVREEPAKENVTLSVEARQIVFSTVRIWRKPGITPGNPEWAQKGFGEQEHFWRPGRTTTMLRLVLLVDHGSERPGVPSYGVPVRCISVGYVWRSSSDGG